MRNLTTVSSVSPFNVILDFNLQVINLISLGFLYIIFNFILIKLFSVGFLHCEIQPLINLTQNLAPSELMVNFNVETNLSPSAAFTGV